MSLPGQEVQTASAVNLSRSLTSFPPSETRRRPSSWLRVQIIEARLSDEYEWQTGSMFIVSCFSCSLTRSDLTRSHLTQSDLTQSDHTRSHLTRSHLTRSLLILFNTVEKCLPPNLSTAFWTASSICCSSRMSTTQANAFPPAASTDTGNRKQSLTCPVSMLRGHAAHWADVTWF